MVIEFKMDLWVDTSMNYLFVFVIVVAIVEEIDNLEDE